MRLDGKVRALVDVIPRVPQSSVSRSLLIILYTSELFRIVGYADDTTVYAFILRPPSSPHAME